MNATTFQSICVVSACLAGLAMPATAAGLVQLTGPSPFSGCTSDDVASQPGINFPNAAVEPWVDANPANSGNLIAGWQQDRWSNGGSRGNVSAYSTNGGSTWTSVVVPAVTLCSGGTFERASDPWVTISPDGTAYFMSLSFMNDLPTGSLGANSMLVNRSTNGGDGVAKTRDRLRKLRAAQNLGGPINPATIFTGPTYFTRTVNGGNSWEAAKKIFDPGNNAQTINNLTEVLPNGKVIVFFTHIMSWGGVKLGMVKSANKGGTFGPLSHAFHMVVTDTGTLTPDARQPVRDANILFDTAVDRGNGNLYVVWQDGRSRNIDKVAFSMSTNGGASWSTPAIVSKTPYSANKLRNQAFLPSVVVGANHKVVVTYYDFRNDTNNGKEATDFWAISCNIAAGANCRTAGGWGSEARLTPTSFDMLDAPVARGHFLGDYMGLVNAGGTVTAVFGKPAGDNLSDMFATTIP